MLSFGEPLEMPFANLTAQSPLLGEPSVPLPANLLPFGVIVLAGVTKLFRVIRLCLTCAQRFGDGQHVLAYSKKSLCWRAGSRWIFWSSLCCCSFGTSFCPDGPFPDGLPAPAAAAATFGGSSGGGCAGRSMYCGSRLSSSMYGRLIRATRFAHLWELLICAALSYPLDLLFSYGVANPFRCVRLARAQEDFRRRLRHHRFRFVPITHFQLAASLETQHHRIVGFAVLRDRRVQLRQPLQGRQLVQNEPYRTRTHAALIHQTQHEHVQPQTDERREGLPRVRRAGEKEPAVPSLRPFERAPTPLRLRFTREQLHGVGYHAQRTKHAVALWRRIPVDHCRVLCPFHSSVDLFRVRHPPHQLLWCRMEAEQVRKDFSRGFHEERVFVVSVGKQ